MGLAPATEPDDLVHLRTQITKAQLDWLKSQQRRFQDRSVAPAIRRAMQVAMDTEQRARQDRAS